MQKMHKSLSDHNSNHRPPVYYNLDVIISVGYRVKSPRGVAFRKWALEKLKEYLIKGYAINQKRLEALVAITILTAESNPNEMDIIITLIMNLLA